MDGYYQVLSKYIYTKHCVEDFFLFDIFFQIGIEPTK